MKKSDVEQTLKKGVVINTPYVIMHALLSASSVNQQKAQTAFIVSKKVHASAVQRHKYQRWMREIIRQQEGFLPSNLMLALTAKPNIKESKSFKQLQKSLSPLLSTKEKFWDSLSK